MVSTTIIISLLLLLGLTLIAMALYFKIKAKKERNNIPANLLNELTEVERRLRETNGSKNQNQIIYELATEHYPGRIREINAGLSAIEKQSIADKRTIVQSRDIKQSAGDEGKSETDRYSNQKNNRWNKSTRFNPI